MAGPDDSADWQRLAVEQAAVGIIQLGPDGTLWQVNPGFCRILDRDAPSLLGRDFVEQVHPDDIETSRGWAARALAGEVDAYVIELRMLRKDTRSVWVELTHSVARDATGRFLFSVAVAQDVSARRSAEQTLRRRVVDFFSAFDAAQAPMAQTDPVSGRFLCVNPRFCALTGHAESELLELTIEQLTHPEDRGRGPALLSGFAPERRYLRKDGSILWAILYASPMRHDSGELFRTLSAWVDVSESKRAEGALRLSEARFRTLVEAGPFMVYSSDAEGMPSYLGPSLTTYLGLTLEQVRNEDVLRSIVHPEDFARIDELRAPAPSVVGAELRLRRADGSFRWFLARTVALRDDEGRFLQRIGSLTDIHDRKTAELALAQSEERFRLASEAVDGLIYDVDLESGRVHRSPGISRTLGFAAEEIPPTADAWAERMHPEDREAARARADAAWQGGLDAIALEYRVRHKAGHWVDLWDNQRILRDPQGRPVRVVGHCIDVTARKRAEEALRASEARLTALANATPALAWSTTHDGTNSWASEAWLRYTGLPVAEPGEWPPMLHPLDAERSMSAWQRALASETDFEIENRIRRHDGEHRWFLTRAVPLRDERGAVTGWMGASTDIHALKLAEETLRESEERFRILADGSPVLIWVNGLAGCEFVNRAYREFLGVEHDADVRGYDWAPFVHPEDRESYLAAYADALAGEASFQREFRFRRHDGEYRWMLSAGSPRRGPSGELLGYVGSTLDITERKQAEAALREDDRRKDEFLATLAHELRNPLAPIRNAVEVLRLARVEHPQLDWARNMIGRQVEQLTRLVDDLLEVNRITRGTLSLRKQTIAVSELLRDVAEASRPLLAEQGQELEVALRPDPLFLHADPVRLAQVLANLLDNAAKHSAAGARIRLSAECEGDELRLSVRDSGRGMTSEELSRVFEMFYQAGDRAQRKPGLGVGLALVKRLVELHGGTVEARSDGLGQGSTFEVRLPLLEALAPERGPHAPEPPLTKPRRVLVVDDNPDSTASLAALVKLLGHEVETAADGIEACEVAGRFRPDVVLLDIGMPGLDGYGAARRIRGAPWGAGMVLVAQTGWAQEPDRRLAVEAGFDLQLTKPVDPAALRRILAEAFEAQPA